MDTAKVMNIITSIIQNNIRELTDIVIEPE